MHEHKPLARGYKRFSDMRQSFKHKILLDDRFVLPDAFHVVIVDDGALFDNVATVADFPAKFEVLVRQKEGHSPFLNFMDDVYQASNNQRSEPFGGFIQKDHSITFSPR
jgi:hypothetical protein